MKIETINPYVMKIIISGRKEDSINSIARRIKLSYGWTYKWVKELIRMKVFKASKLKLILNEENKFYQDTLKYIKTNFSNDINFHYSVLDLFGVRYCFTKTDAVFIWTKGGYNIARYRDFYPIFIKVSLKDKKLFEEYCKKLSLSIKEKKGIFYHPIYLSSFDIDYCNNAPVDSLEETISFMKKQIYNFQPALEMIKEMYNKRIKVEYSEVNTNV